MNCIRCNMPLEANARFCRNCGQPVSPSSANPPSGPGIANPSPLSRPISRNNEAPTIPPTAWQPSTPSPSTPSYQQQPLTQRSTLPPITYQPKVGTMQSGTGNQQQPKPKRRGRGCLVSSLVTLLIVVLLVVGGWFLV